MKRGKALGFFVQGGELKAETRATVRLPLVGVRAIGQKKMNDVVGIRDVPYYLSSASHPLCG
jgi:hypothetical protein